MPVQIREFSHMGRPHRATYETIETGNGPEMLVEFYEINPTLGPGYDRLLSQRLHRQVAPITFVIDSWCCDDLCVWGDEPEDSLEVETAAFAA